MAENTVKGQKKPNTAGSEYNALQFVIQQAMNRISTAIPVRVQAVDGLYVDAVPLVSNVDGYGEAVTPTTLFHLPVFRYHAGVGAVILDPVVGDIGLAVFAQADSSNVTEGTTKPQQPGSFRRFSMSDGFYIGGFHNGAPSVYIEIQQDGHIIINAPAGVTVTSPQATFSGEMDIAGDCTIGGISFLSHVHENVEPGSGTSGTPQ